MELTAIVILSLMIVWIILSMIRDSNRNKWYRRGYVEASCKYDQSDDYSISYADEADAKFNEKHGFKYD